jgi:hypothetical protein
MARNFTQQPANYTEATKKITMNGGGSGTSAVRDSDVIIITDISENRMAGRLVGDIGGEV